MQAVAVRNLQNIYRCRYLIVFVNAITNTNPECNEKSCESNYSKSKVTRLDPYFPQCHYKCMNGECLVNCTSAR